VGRLELWLLRPGQGLGLLLLLASKVLALLQLYTGSGLQAEDLPSLGQPLARLRLTVWGAGAAISLLLTALWTTDDLGLRLYQARRGEIRRLGRCLGLALPALFGLYGIYQVFSENAHLPALRLTLRMIMVLYPPFVALSVLHAHLLPVFQPALLARLRARAGVWALQPADDREQAAPTEEVSPMPSPGQARDQS
jgi:hypothetical protein